jgi:hypothetical protein
MFVGECPHHGPTLLSYTSLLTLVNYEPGIIVIHWSCLCGEEHITATGTIGSTDPARAAAAIDSVRRQLALGTTVGDGCGSAHGRCASTRTKG